MHHRHTLLCLPLLLSTIAAQTPGVWNEVSFVTRPFARERHAMVFDLARGEAVVYGGHNGAYMNDTWILDGTGWVRRFPAVTPGARADHAMAYDPIRQRTVLFGGSNGADIADVWEWDGIVWTLRASTVPGVGSGGAATYDPLQGGVFYNRDAVNLLWDGTTATTITVAQPMGGQVAGIVFDAASGGVVMLRGNVTSVFHPPQGWQVRHSTSLFALSSYAIAADPLQHSILFHGGNGSIGNGNGPAQGYTWDWTGSSWSPIGGQLPTLAGHTMVLDGNRSTFVMFGGRNNGGSLRDRTYAWNEATLPADYTTYGAGCAGALASSPRLRADALWNTAPVLGGSFFALVDQLVPAQPVFGFVGLSNQTWNGNPLPHSLATHGMPGCDLLLAPAATVYLGLGSSGGTANWVTAIPASAGLVGVQFFQQAMATAPGANGPGLLWSNGGHGTIGVR